MQVSKWGNSLAIRIPASVDDALDLKEGDEIEITATGRTKFDVARKPTVEERLAVLRRHRGSLPADFKFNRDEANER